MKLTIKAKVFSKTRDEIILTTDKEQVVVRINDHSLGVEYLSQFTDTYNIGDEIIMTLEPPKLTIGKEDNAQPS